MFNWPLQPQALPRYIALFPMSHAQSAHMKPKARGNHIASAGNAMIRIKPRNMDRSSQMSQRTVDSMDAPLSRQLTMRLTAKGGVNWPKAML